MLALALFLNWLKFRPIANYDVYLSFDGNPDIIYRNAHNTLGHGAKRWRQLTDEEGDEREFKNS